MGCKSYQGTPGSRQAFSRYYVSDQFFSRRSEVAKITYHGGCHCGRIAIEVEGEIDIVIECNCSLCSRRGSLLHAVPRDRLRLTRGEGDLATYTFHTGRIQHRFCPTCGCAPFSEGTDKSGERAAMVNVRCLEDIDLSTLQVTPFDGRSY